MPVMQAPLPASPREQEPDAAAFYRRVLQALNASGLPFLVGGGHALQIYTGISRYTKDLDLFIQPQDYAPVSEALVHAGYEAELTYPHWLGKVHAGAAFVDLIFSSGNGVAEVDELWFRHARDAEVMGMPVRITPPEESIWSKGFIMERERYDGADVVHLLHACAHEMDWQRLRQRFGLHWRVLLSHLVLFGFVYPAERSSVPAWLMDDLLERARRESDAPPSDDAVCAGTLLSREQYLYDLEHGYRDGRAVPLGTMTAQDLARWTASIPDRVTPGSLPTGAQSQPPAPPSAGQPSAAARGHPPSRQSKTEAPAGAGGVPRGRRRRPAGRSRRRRETRSVRHGSVE
jgi:hypothetical protein